MALVYSVPVNVVALSPRKSSLLGFQLFQGKGTGDASGAPFQLRLAFDVLKILPPFYVRLDQLLMGSTATGATLTTHCLRSTTGWREQESSDLPIFGVGFVTYLGNVQGLSLSYSDHKVVVGLLQSDGYLDFYINNVNGILYLIDAFFSVWALDPRMLSAQKESFGSIVDSASQETGLPMGGWTPGPPDGWHISDWK
jgi:hypothetical protein